VTFEQIKIAPSIVNMGIAKNHETDRTRSMDFDTNKFDVIFIVPRPLAFRPAMGDNLV
jgi:hypothetical protein